MNSSNTIKIIRILAESVIDENEDVDWENQENIDKLKKTCKKLLSNDESLEYSLTFLEKDLQTLADSLRENSTLKDQLRQLKEKSEQLEKEKSDLANKPTSQPNSVKEQEIVNLQTEVNNKNQIISTKEQEINQLQSQVKQLKQNSSARDGSSWPQAVGFVALGGLIGGLLVSHWQKKKKQADDD